MERTVVEEKAYSNGAPAWRIQYLDGYKHGTWEAWEPDGTPRWVVTYRKGDRHGPYREYGPKGQLVDACEYVLGARQRS